MIKSKHHEKRVRKTKPVEKNKENRLRKWTNKLLAERNLINQIKFRIEESKENLLKQQSNIIIEKSKLDDLKDNDKSPLKDSLKDS